PPAHARPPPAHPPFPYTTLFRSSHRAPFIGSPLGKRLRLPERGIQRRPTRCRQRLLQGHALLHAAQQRLRVPRQRPLVAGPPRRSEEHTSELQSRENLVCRLLLE